MEVRGSSPPTLVAESGPSVALPSAGDVSDDDRGSGAGTVRPCRRYRSLMLIRAGPAGEAPTTLAGLSSSSGRVPFNRADAGLPVSFCSEIGAITASLACRNSFGIGVRLVGAASSDRRIKELRRGGGVLLRRDPVPASLGSGGMGLAAAAAERAGMELCDATFGCDGTSALLRADALVPRDEIESHRRPSLGKLANRDDSCMS